MNVEFTTKKGAKIELRIVTETPNLADHNVTNKCYDLQLLVNNKRKFGSISIIDHKDHGVCIKPQFESIFIPVPGDKVKTVRDLIANYYSKIHSDFEILIQEENNYQSRKKRINQMMSE